MTNGTLTGQTSHTAGTRALGLVVALAAFAYYAWRSSLSPYLLDSAELAAASFTLGVAHPPGEALALLWGRLFSMLPMGSVAFRVSLGQAACGAAVVYVVYLLAFAACDLLTSALRPSLWSRAFMCGCGALVFALSPGAADVSSRPEVYALATLLALTALACAQNANHHDDARWALGAAFALGLGLANHPLIAGAAGVGAVVACIPLLTRAEGMRERAVLVFAAVVALVAGALVLSYAPMRAYALLGHPEPHSIVWGDARSVSGLWWLLSAQTFAEKNHLVQASADPFSLPFIFSEEVGVAALCLGALGLYVLARFSAAGRIAMLSLCLCGVGAVLSAVAGGLDPFNPDVRGYLGCGFAIAVVFASVGACVLVARVRAASPRRLVGVGLAFAFIAQPLWALATSAYARNGTRNVRSPEIAMAEALFETPPRAVLLTAHFETAFLLSYMRAVQAQRPDIDWVHLGWARTPGYSQRMLALSPGLAAVFADHQHGTRITAKSVDGLDVPFAVESSVALTPTLAQALSYSGSLWHWPPQPPQDNPTGIRPSMFAEAEQQRAVRGFLAWRVFQDARLACQTHHPVAPKLIATVQRLLPEDNAVKRLPMQCGLAP